MNKLKSLWKKLFQAVARFLPSKSKPKSQEVEIIPVELSHGRFFARSYHQLIGFKNGELSQDGPFDEVKLIEKLDIRQRAIPKK